MEYLFEKNYKSTKNLFASCRGSRLEGNAMEKGCCHGLRVWATRGNRASLVSPPCGVYGKIRCARMSRCVCREGERVRVVSSDASKGNRLETTKELPLCDR